MKIKIEKGAEKSGGMFIWGVKLVGKEGKTLPAGTVLARDLTSAKKKAKTLVKKRFSIAPVTQEKAPKKKGAEIVLREKARKAQIKRLKEAERKIIEKTIGKTVPKKLTKAQKAQIKRLKEAERKIIEKTMDKFLRKSQE